MVSKVAVVFAIQFCRKKKEYRGVSTGDFIDHARKWDTSLSLICYEWVETMCLSVHPSGEGSWEVLLALGLTVLPHGYFKFSLSLFVFSDFAQWIYISNTM